MYMCVYIYIFVCTYMCTYIYVYIYLYMCIYFLYIYTHVCLYVCVCTCLYRHTCIHSFTALLSPPTPMYYLYLNYIDCILFSSSCLILSGFFLLRSSCSHPNAVLATLNTNTLPLKKTTN